jgi:hypothetical protein
MIWFSRPISQLTIAPLPPPDFPSAGLVLIRPKAAKLRPHRKVSAEGASVLVMLVDQLRALGS